MSDDAARTEEPATPTKTAQAEPRRPGARSTEQPGGRRIAIGLIAALLVLFAALAFSAERTKSPTVDEPGHLLGAYLRSTIRDFRVDPEDPPLWADWMFLPHGRDALRHIDFDDPSWRQIPQMHWTLTPWWQRTLYDPANDVESLVQRSRAMALIIGVALGVMIAWYAWRFSGSLAALIATCLFALDPNFLAHAAVVKNDVAATLIFLALAYALWRAGSRLTWTNTLAIALLGGVAMSVKFSGLLAIPIVGVLLLIRALLLPTPWPIRWRKREKLLEKPQHRLLLACLVIAATIPASMLIVWASYGFRYRAIPDGTPMNIALQKALAIKSRIRAAADDPSYQPTPQELAATPPGAFVSSILFLSERHALPEAWLNGLLFTYHASLIRPSYLLREIRLTGWWYYFPLAMVFKTPLATLVLALLAIIVAARIPLREIDSSKRWALLCLLVPTAIYFLFALRTNLNIGLRHVLPIYPPIYIAIGCAIASAWRTRMRWVRPITVTLMLILSAETLFAWPDYIAYFNLAAGGPRGGIRLLGDSNLDWGQDLKALARWQRAHPDRPIYLRYFGSTEPSKYLHSQRLDPANPQWPEKPAVVAISATFLQGLYVPDHMRPIYETLRRQKPIAVIGGTIYIFDPPPPAASSTAATSPSPSSRDVSTTATRPSGTNTSP